MKRLIQSVYACSDRSGSASTDLETDACRSGRAGGLVTRRSRIGAVPTSFRADYPRLFAARYPPFRRLTLIIPSGLGSQLNVRPHRPRLRLFVRAHGRLSRWLVVAGARSPVLPSSSRQRASHRFSSTSGRRAVASRAIELSVAAVIAAFASAHGWRYRGRMSFGTSSRQFTFVWPNPAVNRTRRHVPSPGRASVGAPVTLIR